MNYVKHEVHGELKGDALDMGKQLFDEVLAPIIVQMSGTLTKKQLVHLLLGVGVGVSQELRGQAGGAVAVAVLQGLARGLADVEAMRGLVHPAPTTPQ
jgi:hypothetical protein